MDYEQELKNNYEYTIGENGVAMINNTFWGDFTIAESLGGATAIKDTYNRAKKEWGDNIFYVAALALTLNHKSWQHYDQGDQEMSRLYVKLWQEFDEWVLAGKEQGDEFVFDNFTRDEIRYYTRALD